MVIDMLTLDTSGTVKVTRRTPFGDTITHGAIWSDLSPFAQGYVEAIFAELQQLSHTTGWAYRYLSPEALAMILRDCEAYRARYQSSTHEQGAAFWAARQNPTRYFSGWNADFPPLRVYLNDDGKVMLEIAK